MTFEEKALREKYGRSFSVRRKIITEYIKGTKNNPGIRWADEYDGMFFLMKDYSLIALKENIFNVEPKNWDGGIERIAKHGSKYVDNCDNWRDVTNEELTHINRHKSTKKYTGDKETLFCLNDLYFNLYYLYQIIWILDKEVKIGTNNDMLVVKNKNGYAVLAPIYIRKED